jgi:IS1 family transposase
MNVLSLEKRVQIITLLVEGNSIRATTRITGCSKNTIAKLLVDVGTACLRFHDEKVRNVKAKRVQCDEIWSFVYAKRKNVPEDKKGEAGDVWTWTGIDADSKLIISWFVGGRDIESAHEFMQDVSSRLTNRVQLTTDGLKAYLDAAEDAFPKGVDFAQLDKQYAKNRYVGAIKTPLIGKPDNKYITTSHVERQNLTMRMHMRRFTRCTNAFSKKVENHCHALALYFVYYNFCKIHTTLRVTPAMEAGLTTDIMEITDIVKLIE